MRYHLALLFGLLAAAMASTQASAERRVALVVGNSHYVNTVELRNPDNDAQDVAAKLKQLGFQVMLGLISTRGNLPKRSRSSGVCSMVPTSGCSSTPGTACR